MLLRNLVTQHITLSTHRRVFFKKKVTRIRTLRLIVDVIIQCREWNVKINNENMLETLRIY